MILSDNLNILKQRFPFLYEQMKAYEYSNTIENVEIIDSKTGVPTLYYKDNDTQIFIHSKYNPIDEASKLLEKYSVVSKYKHVFFFGIGLGYHIEAFMNKHPQIAVSLYEPDKEIFNKFISLKSLNQLLKGKVASIYAGEEYKEIDAAASHFVDIINGDVLFVSLPSYERIFAQCYKRFLKIFQEAVSSKKTSIYAQTTFQKQWTTNALSNFIEVLGSTNIIEDKKDFFQGKPAIIVSAGPSLEEELENLRYIKENNLAYIFSAGSAINTLIDHEIYPDAACAYDPYPNNLKVFQKVIDNNIETIPLIFGSSVYSGLLKNYPGQKFHIINQQDTISPYYLQNEKGNKPDIIIDAPSIAIILLQLLIKLECDPIILVGQNLAYKNDKYYAKGINYVSRPTEATQGELSHAILVESTGGSMIQTNQGLDVMRKQLERYLQYIDKSDIINATKGGAKIENTLFMTLEDIIKEKLKMPVVSYAWLEDSDNRYDMNYILKKHKEVLMDYDKSYEEIDNIIDIFSDMERAIEKSDIRKIEKLMNDFDRDFNTLINNSFFQMCLRPMNRVAFEEIIKNIEDIRLEKDFFTKGKLVLKYYKEFILSCKKDRNEIMYLFEGMSDDILDLDIKILSFIITAA